MNVDLKPHHICQAATQLIREKGFDEVTMSDIARKAGLPEAELYTFFGNKLDIILFLYQSINTDWQIFVNDITEKKLADRVEKALIAKVELMHPYSGILSNMMGVLLRDPKVGINAPRTSHIRAMGLQVMQKLVDGATDSKSLRNKIDKLPSLLYIMHWAILFLDVQTDDKEKTIESVKLAAKMLQQANNLSFFLNLFPFFTDMSAWSARLLDDAAQPGTATDKEILKIIFNNRKVTEADKECLENRCDTCMGQHLPKISYFTRQQKPIHFILPAFPAKSPNHTKVLGSLPDLGEEIALKTLDDLCKEIANVYEPGAHLTICSDGRIFSELVGVTDVAISDYVAGIRRIIEKLHLQHISIVNLEDLMQGNSFDELRNKVLETYAEPLDDMNEKLKSNAEFKSLFNGIHRFITDDRKVMDPEKSISKVKKESSDIALKVIQHSNAWTRFLAYIYPDAVRLSIHPYPAHSAKIGIQLTKATDNWLTPWHGVIVLQQDGYILMKKHEAEAAGAKLMFETDQPYYYASVTN